MAQDVYGFLGCEPGSEISDTLLETIDDDLLRIFKIITGDEGEDPFSKEWNHEDYEIAHESWINYWLTVAEYILENSTESTYTVEELFTSGETYIFGEIITEELGTSFSVIVRKDGFPIVSCSIEEVRIQIEQLDYQIKEEIDAPPVPELNLSPEVSEIEFSGFIKGVPQAKWTIRNLLEDLERKKLVFPSWQRKSDAWSPGKKQNLIRSLLLKIPLPSIIIHKRNDGVREVVDGRQRISALKEFFENQFKTAKFDQRTVLNKTGALPADASGIEFFGDKYWEDMQESKLIIGENQSEDVEDWMNDQVIPSLEFSGLTDEQLYYIFTVYNTNSTPLNAAEIRNAVYHDAPMHRALMREAGDLEDEQGDPIPPTEEMATLAYRAGLSPKKPPTRFSASEALMRAFAFSMISPKDDGRHKADSAAKAIQSTLIMSRNEGWTEEDCNELANRAMNAYQTMRAAFQRVGLDPINRPSGERQTLRYNTVRATSMHAAFILLDECRYQGLELKGKDFDEFVNLIDGVEQDDKQSNTKTWNYHLQVVFEFIRFVGNCGISHEELLKESYPYHGLVHASILALG